jgi:hypothetical protein
LPGAAPELAHAVRAGRSQREKAMVRILVIVATSAATLFSSAAVAQESSQGTTSMPDFSGIWTHPYFPGFEPPRSGPGPLVNKSRLLRGPQIGIGNANQLVGDYANPILKPQAAKIVKKHGEISLNGVGYPTPSNQCWPEGVPFIFWNIGMQLLQQRDKITILYNSDHEVRRVRLNQPHLTPVTPSWYGDSIGHYEGQVLVIDTVGVKIGPYAMVDLYGTPHTQALHVIERYRLLDYESAKDALERGAKENVRLPPATLSLDVNPDYRGKYLQLQFTVEDEGVFTTPWSATITYSPGFNWRGADEWPELACAENPYQHGTGKDAAVPHAEKPDF